MIRPFKNICLDNQTEPTIESRGFKEKFCLIKDLGAPTKLVQKLKNYIPYLL